MSFDVVDFGNIRQVLFHEVLGGRTTGEQILNASKSITSVTEIDLSKKQEIESTRHRDQVNNSKGFSHLL